MRRRVRMLPIETEDTVNDPAFRYIWHWKTRLSERKGEPCRIATRAVPNSVLVTFADGFQTVAPRHAVRLKTEISPQRHKEHKA